MRLIQIGQSYIVADQIAAVILKRNEKTLAVEGVSIIMAIEHPFLKNFFLTVKDQSLAEEGTPMDIVGGKRQTWAEQILTDIIDWLQHEGLEPDILDLQKAMIETARTIKG